MQLTNFQDFHARVSVADLFGHFGQPHIGSLQTMSFLVKSPEKIVLSHALEDASFPLDDRWKMLTY